MLQLALSCPGWHYHVHCKDYETSAKEQELYKTELHSESTDLIGGTGKHLMLQLAD